MLAVAADFGRHLRQRRASGAGEARDDLDHGRGGIYRIESGPIPALGGGRACPQPGQADLRGQSAEPGSGLERSAPCLRTRRHRRRRSNRPPARAISPPCGSQSRGREPRRPLDPRSRQLHADQRGRHLPSARGGPRLLGGPARRPAGPFPLPPGFDGRGLRLTRRRGAARRRGRTLRAQQSLCGEQGRGRPPGALVPPHLRPAGADHQLLQQLRPVPVSREADPARDPPCARRQAHPGLRRRRQHPRLAPCRGPLCRDRARAGRRPPRRELQYRRDQRATQHRAGQADLRDARRGAAASRRRLVPAADRIRGGPAGPRPALRDRCWKDPARAGLGAKPELRGGAAPDHSLVSEQSGLGEQCHHRRLSRLDRPPVRRERRSPARGSSWRADRERGSIRSPGRSRSSCCRSKTSR